MKEPLKLSYKKENVRDAIRFLNESAASFYDNLIEFEDSDYPMFFRSSLLMAMNDVEGSIKGTFNCELPLGTANIEMLKQMYPTACQVLNIKTSDDVKELGHILSTLRNINAHAKPSSHDFFLFRYLKIEWGNIKPLNQAIYLYKNNTPTVASIAMLVMLFLREESINKLCKSSYVFSLLSCGSFRLDDGKTFVRQISHVNLEVPIRQQTGSDVISSVVGEHQNIMRKIGVEDQECLIAYNKDKYFDAIFNFDGKEKFTMRQGSLTQVYYKSDFVLAIKDIPGFIELSNLFPPFVFIDLLYRLEFQEFNKVSYSIIKSDIEAYSKLNYPKFYIDKNIDILIAPETVADIRIVSSSLTSALNSIFLSLERSIYDHFSYRKSKTEYSRIKDAFELVGFDGKLKESAIRLRNFAMHRMLLNEYAIIGDKTYQYNIDFIIDTLVSIEKHFKNTNETLFNSFMKDVENFFIKRMVSVKYNKVIEYTLDVFEGNKRYDPNGQDVNNKFLFVEGSVYDITKLNKLFINNDQQTYVLKFVIKGIKRPLFIRNNTDQIQQLRAYLKSIGSFQTIEEEDHGIIKTIYLKKE